MRGISLIGAMVLLASCGSGAPDNEATSNGDLLPQGANETSSAVSGESAPITEDRNAAATHADAVSACLMQGDERLEVKPIRANGTEPFWSARVEGRCVTYSTPEDQQGTRVWTRYSAGQNGSGAWVGQLGGKAFEMRTRAEPGCSDGMSDTIYPIAVELTVNGEQRRGCAEPL